MDAANAQKIIDACEAEWEANKSDCNKFLRAVGSKVGIVIISGDADAIIDSLVSPSGWFELEDGGAAKTEADKGSFVVAGLKGGDHNPPRAHGHVAVVVSGPLDPTHGKYPTGYWGSLGGVGKKNATLNYSWNEADRDNVSCYFKTLP